MGNLRRMHPVGTGSFIHSFEPFERFERHTGFELCAVLFPLCRHLPSPHLHRLLTQHSILITCPVFGVHYRRYRRNSKDYERSVESSTAMIQISNINTSVRIQAAVAVMVP